MIPAIIRDATHRLTAPKGWDTAKDGPCVALFVRQTGDNFESLWEPTPAELEALLRGGKILLRVNGGQPAVMLQVSQVDTGELVE